MYRAVSGGYMEGTGVYRTVSSDYGRHWGVSYHIIGYGRHWDVPHCIKWLWKALGCTAPYQVVMEGIGAYRIVSIACCAFLIVFFSTMLHFLSLLHKVSLLKTTVKYFCCTQLIHHELIFLITCISHRNFFSFTILDSSFRLKPIAQVL